MFVQSIKQILTAVKLVCVYYHWPILEAMFYPGKDVTYPQVTDIYYMLARKSVHEYYDFLFVALASSHGECSKDGNVTYTVKC